jgi:hypothetical protein
MPLNPAEAETAYRLILERTPSPEEIANAVNQHDKLGALRHMLLNSEEFYRKFDTIREGFLKRINPVLVHLHIPEAVDPMLFSQLAAAQDLQPATPADPDSFSALCAKPRHERLKLHYIYGDLTAGAGDALNLPFMHLCTIARPGPRLYRLYRAACDAQGASKMSFGTYLEYSLDSLVHRLELDNGQVRRLAGPPDASEFGREKELLARAFHHAFSPDMIFGFFEDTAALARRLGDEGLMTSQPPDTAPTTDEKTSEDGSTADHEFTRALDALGKDARIIFDAYTAWDTYFYDVCRALLSTTSAETA